MNIDPTSLAHLRHELRTPLNHIIGYSEMLLEELAPADPAALAASLHSVHATAHHVLARINEFLGDLPHENGPFDLTTLSAELVVPLESMAGDLAALTPPAKPSDAGTHPVTDDARGRDDLARIAGAVATLRTLLAAPPLPLGAALPAPMAPAAAARHVEAGAILIVDDDLNNREMLGRRIARDGHRVVLAASGAEALAVVREQPIDLVLLDVMMPGMDGEEVLRQLKADARWHDIPVLMISALDQSATVVRCIEIGAEDYLPYLLDPVILRARIGACLEKKRLREREASHLQQLAEWNARLEQRVAEQVSLLERMGRLKRFFSPQLAELIVAGGADDPLRTHRREVTVCFLDLRGFTAFAEPVEPEEVMGVLREYHAEMGRLILAHEGTLERFTGDGMMIFFNDPVPVPDAGDRVVRMALAMRERVAGLVRRWHKLGYELDLGIGIAQGYATIGAIGFEGRWDYGAIGSVTNLASRLCGEAKPGQILVAKRIAALTEDLAETRPVGELVLKGFQRPVAVYELLGLRDAS